MKKINSIFIVAIMLMTQMGCSNSSSKKQDVSSENGATSNYEIVAKISPPNPDMSGIAVSSDNRIFLGFPRHADNHTEFALTELVDGKPVAWPNKEYVYPSTKPYNEWLVSPHGIYMDKNDVLWVLDDAKERDRRMFPKVQRKWWR